MCRGSTLTTDGRFFANFVRNEGGFTGAIDLGEDLDWWHFEDSQPNLSPTRERRARLI
jgi:hypothetical protein